MKSRVFAFQRSAAMLSTLTQTDLRLTMPVVHAEVVTCKSVRGGFFLF